MKTIFFIIFLALFVSGEYILYQVDVKIAIGVSLCVAAIVSLLFYDVLSKNKSA